MIEYIKNYFKIKTIKRKLKNKTICYLTGAGISINSGIQSFRGSDGVYIKNPDFIVTIQVLKNNDLAHFCVL